MQVRWLWLGLLLLAAPLHAAPAAVVETMLMPAWLYRDAGYVPLVPGMPLRSGDTVLSGSHSRVLLRLEEGSTVKLGEYARFELDSLNTPTPADEIFRGALRVVKGAFRLTTSAVMKHRKREISVRVATITVGIRGTDIWGKVNQERDLLALLEGSIEVSHDSGAKFSMQEPLTYVAAPKNGSLQPIDRISEDQLKVWAAETEPQPGSGLTQPDGSWRVLMGSYHRKATALRAQQFYHAQGYAVELAKLHRGQNRYRLEIHHLASQEDAEAIVAGLGDRFGLEVAGVSRSD
jgi:hypothetical protein